MQILRSIGKKKPLLNGLPAERFVQRTEVNYGTSSLFRQ